MEEANPTRIEYQQPAKMTDKNFRWFPLFFGA
jgi:hypothetical protein